MPTAADLLLALEQPKTTDVRKLAKRLEVKPDQLKEILKVLSSHDIVKYNQRTGEVALPEWLVNINRKVEAIKPAVGEIILPRFQEIRLQDVIIGNYTGEDLELRVRIRRRRKEIAVCSRFHE